MIIQAISFHNPFYWSFKLYHFITHSTDHSIYIISYSILLINLYHFVFHSIDHSVHSISCSILLIIQSIAFHIPFYWSCCLYHFISHSTDYSVDSVSYLISHKLCSITHLYIPCHFTWYCIKFFVTILHVITFIVIILHVIVCRSLSSLFIVLRSLSSFYILLGPLWSFYMLLYHVPCHHFTRYRFTILVIILHVIILPSLW